MRDALVNTPLWVWSILLYILYAGFKATSSREVHISNFFILPVVLLGFKLGTMNFESSINWVYFILCFLMGKGLGYKMATHSQVKINKAIKTVELSGSYSLLISLLLVFILKYALSYLEHTRPMLASQYQFMDHIVSFSVAGYFLGRGLAYFWKMVKDRTSKTR